MMIFILSGMGFFLVILAIILGVKYRRSKKTIHLVGLFIIILILLAAVYISTKLTPDRMPLDQHRYTSQEIKPYSCHRE